MVDQVKADYDALEKVAGLFANQSQAIQQMLMSVQRSMDPLRNEGWIGHAADKFFEEMDGEVLPATARLQEALAEASQTTAEAVRMIQEAEEEASSRFQVG